MLAFSTAEFFALALLFTTFVVGGLLPFITGFAVKVAGFFAEFRTSGPLGPLVLAAVAFEQLVTKSGLLFADLTLLFPLLAVFFVGEVGTPLVGEGFRDFNEGGVICRLNGLAVPTAFTEGVVSVLLSFLFPNAVVFLYVAAKGPWGR